MKRQEPMEVKGENSAIIVLKFGRLRFIPELRYRIVSGWLVKDAVSHIAGPACKRSENVDYTNRRRLVGSREEL